MISFSTVDGSQMLDWIPLLDITSIECVQTLDRRNPSIFREGKSTMSLNAVFSSRSALSPSGRAGSTNRNSGDGAADAVFEIETKLDGCNSGRRYQMRCRCEGDQAEWVAHIRNAWQEALAEQNAESVGYWLRCFRAVKQAATSCYGSREFKILLVLILAANFIMLMVTAQIQPAPDTPAAGAIDRLEYTFTSVFTAELLLNMFVNWFRPFIGDM
jgi:hypothetical protein